MALARFVNQQQDDQRPRKLVIFSDCQAAIQAVQDPKRSSGQHVLLSVYDHVRALRKLQETPTFDTIPVEIRWIPVHVGVPGNETADVEAKLAAKRGGTDQLPAGDSVANSIIQSPGDRLASTTKRRVPRHIKEKWAQEWAKETTGKANRRLVKAPDKMVLRLFESLSNPYTSILIQMRSMRIALNHFLFKIKAVELDECYCGEGSQTPRHILMQCPLYTDLRKTFLDKVRATDLEIRPITMQMYHSRRPPATWPNSCYKQAFWGSSDTSKSSRCYHRATKQRVRIDWQAQVVETMGIRNTDTRD
jgi:ribonuclease HI